MPVRPAAVLVALLVLSGGCAGGAMEPSDTVATGSGATPTEATVTPPVASTGPVSSPTPGAAPSVSPDPAEGPDAPGPAFAAASEPPPWLGTRVLRVDPDGWGYGEIEPTPPELRDRRLITRDLLPPPAHPAFTATVDAVPEEVLARSTWTPDCPVPSDHLRYVTVTFWGFDEHPHTGELLLHADAVDDVVAVFEAAFDAYFPIEEMRIVHPDELDAPPTGDGNNTTAFVCRAVRGATSWSQHAYGLAVDVNPFHNPYAKGELVLPELASAYLDRDWTRPGMLADGDAVVEGFRARGWTWGGDWSSPVDWMHFSREGG